MLEKREFAQAGEELPGEIQEKYFSLERFFFSVFGKIFCRKREVRDIISEIKVCTRMIKET